MVVFPRPAVGERTSLIPFYNKSEKEGGFFMRCLHLANAHTTAWSPGALKTNKELPLGGGGSSAAGCSFHISRCRI